MIERIENEGGGVSVIGSHVRMTKREALQALRCIEDAIWHMQRNGR